MKRIEDLRFDNRNVRLNVEVADSDKFFYVVEAMFEDGSKLIGHYEIACEFESKKISAEAPLQSLALIASLNESFVQTLEDHLWNVLK